MNNTIRTIFIWLIVPLALIMIVVYLRNASGAVTKIPYSQFMEQAKMGNIKEMTISPDQITGEFENPPKDEKGSQFKLFETTIILNDSMIDKIESWESEWKTAKESGANFGDRNVPATFTKPVIKMKNSTTSDVLFQIAIWILPLTILLVLWFFIIRQMQAGGNKAMMFGKSRAKMLTANQKKVTFVDVAGCDEAKEELEEIIEFLREPQKFQRLGGKIPKGVLLVGPPGTGKTLLARATAGEANVPFFSISGSDFVEMFVGVGASRVRDLFDQGKKNAPCIIFIDEIDAVGRHRGAGMGGGHDEREQTLNQLLVEMDGFESNDGVILVAATNRPDVLDPALLRPGRFDRRVVVDLPDVKGREAVIKVHCARVPLAPDVDILNIARGTPGFSGADLANMVNEAALLAARRRKKMVFRIDFEDAKDKILMGAERRSMILSEKEKRHTAVHEAGHAIVAAMVGEKEDTDPIHKVTIIPRGRALGVTMQLPIDDRHSYTSTYLKARLAILMGGRIAEEVFFDQVTSGARDDIQKATNIAKQMVCELGMSEAIGPISLKEGGDQPFLGRDYNRLNNMSEKTAEMIDSEIKRLVEEGDQRARDIITQNRDIVDTMTEKLVELETLHDWQIQQILERQEVTLENPAFEDKKPEVQSESEKPAPKPDDKRPEPMGGVVGKPPLAQT